MKNNLFCPLLLVAATLVFFSCEKYDEYESSGNNKEANSTLIVRTRAAAENNDGDSKISYPVNIYVFNGDDVCVETTSIAAADEDMSLKLPEGSYGVFAIAGADAETYELPTKENATKETVISLKDGKRAMRT